MELTQDQLRRFDEEGLLFLPSLFTPREVEVLNARIPRIFALDRPEIYHEKATGAVRSSYATHHYDEVMARFARHPRLVTPAMQFLGGPVYLHQFKINAKAAFDGEVWQWHQDYGTWANDDQMPEPRAINAALFLDDVTEFNGPLMFIPRSHKRGIVDAEHDATTTTHALWKLDNATVARLAAEGGIVAPKGPAGSVLLFHCNIVHASPPNISPWNRTIVYVSLNRTDNPPRRFERPAYLVERDFRAVEMESDDCLLEVAGTLAR
jgi:ectoine hydroxylase